MRILMLAPEPVYTPRGSPIATVNRCRALTALGLQVDLVTYPMGQDVAMPGLRFVRTPGLPGLHQVKIGPSLAKLPLDALLLWTAARQLRRCRYDVIHTVEEAGVAGWLLHAIFRVPYVHDVHSDLTTVLGDYGFGRRNPVTLLARWLERRVLTGAEVIIVNFPGLVAGVTAKAPGKAVHVINCWPLGRRADPVLCDTLRGEWGEDRPVILYVGSFEPYQGLPLLLEAMTLIQGSFPKARLVMVGGRPGQVAEVTQQAERLGLGDIIICTGLRLPMRSLPISRRPTSWYRRDASASTLRSRFTTTCGQASPSSRRAPPVTCRSSMISAQRWLTRRRKRSPQRWSPCCATLPWPTG